MLSISVSDVSKAVGGRIVSTLPPESFEEKKINAVLMDSRKIEKNNLFVAIKGERADGHNFISEVIKKGAAAVICDHVPKDFTEGVCIVVEDTVKALQDLAEWYRSNLKVKVVGITGSVGKTSTKEMLWAVLSYRFKTQKTLGNYNNEIGLPLTVLAIEAETEVVVLEMGISDFGEMRLLSKIARPDICVITNIGQSHLENLGTRDGILKAKTEIFEYRNPKGPIFLNGDDDKLITIKEVSGTKPVFYGFNEENYARAEEIESLGLKGTKMKICLGENKFFAQISMIGNHMVKNALVASAVGEYLGMTFEEIKKGLEKAETIGGRSNLIPFGEGFIIDDCYNAAPTSMMAALDTLTLAKGSKTAVLGDMFELGKDEASMHFEVGRYAAGKNLSKIIFIGKLSHFMYEGAKSENTETKLRYFENLEDFFEVIKEEISNEGNVLVKASNGMHFDKIVSFLKEM